MITIFSLLISIHSVTKISMQILFFFSSSDRQSLRIIFMINVSIFVNVMINIINATGFIIGLFARNCVWSMSGRLLHLWITHQNECGQNGNSSSTFGHLNYNHENFQFSHFCVEKTRLFRKYLCENRHLGQVLNFKLNFCSIFQVSFAGKFSYGFDPLYQLTNGYIYRTEPN